MWVECEVGETDTFLGSIHGAQKPKLRLLELGKIRSVGPDSATPKIEGKSQVSELDREEKLVRLYPGGRATFDPNESLLFSRFSCFKPTCIHDFRRNAKVKNSISVSDRENARPRGF